ncbi:trigger factor [mine drainage metagenome]|uniref:peptidylprolyl isomerase n=1 Tax=mine drainage metagenome TaxID=410659 RepID=A0A1J5SG20_9ZZZZ
MNIQINDLSATRKNLVVSLEANEVDAEHKAVVSQFCRLAQLPGFRPGKAPVAMVIKRYGKDIEGEFRQKVVSKAFQEATSKDDIAVAAVAKIDEGTIEPGAAATVTITVDVHPEFEVPEYVGLPTEVSAVDATEQEIDAIVEGMRAERAEFKTVERAAQKGDYVKLGYEGKVDGKPVAEIAADRQIYAKVPQTWEEVEGEHEGLIPGLGKQLAGLKTGDKKDVTIEFPATFEAVPALAGKSAVYSLEIQEVRERVLPVMDEAFFKSQNATDLETLRASIRENVKGQKEMQNRSGQRRQVIDAVCAKVDFPLPEALVEGELQSVLRQFIEENMRRGVPQEQFEKDKKEIVEGARKAAAQRVKSQLILSKIAEKEKIEVVERDFDAYIYRETMRTGEKPEKIVKSLTEDRDHLRSVQRGIIYDKTVDFLVSKATVSTVQPKA